MDAEYQGAYRSNIWETQGTQVPGMNNVFRTWGVTGTKPSNRAVDITNATDGCAWTK